MKKADYLKQALLRDISLTTKWVFSICSITKTQNQEPWLPIYQSWGCEFLNDDMTLVKIEDSKPNQPLFLANEKIEIDETWFINNTKKITTCIGNIIFNRQVIVPSFGKKMNYIENNTTISKIESKLVSIMKDVPDDPSQKRDNEIYCDEYVRFRDNVQTIKQYSQLFTYSATRKNICAPTGIEQKKKELAEDPRFKGKLQDSLVLAEYEKELKAFDDDYLKGDPSRGKFVAGKVVNIHRKKLFLTLGKEVLSFDGKSAHTVVNSLNEGVDHNNKEDFVAAMNSLRVGSYSRGAETVKGGVDTKILGRFGDTITIEDTDCGSTMGVDHLVTGDNLASFVGGYLLEKGKPKLINDASDLGAYLGKTIKMRSPARCWMPSSDEKLCRVCSGENLFKYKDGMGIPMKEIGGIILNTSMKAMHGKVLSTAFVDINIHAS